MTHPFRFGVQLGALDPARWVSQVREIESLGYSSLFFPDHFGTQWDPTTAITAAAAVTRELRVGSLVYDVDYRHPVIHAKAAATLQLLSGGRHEFGLGAGWMESDYAEAGMTYDRPGVRIRRLEEALTIIRSMWTRERTSFEGEHYTIREIAGASEPLPDPPPRILIGGGGRKLLGVAGRHADIVGVNPAIPEGRVTAHTAADLAPERIDEKIRWIEEAASAAGRDPKSLERNALVFVVAFLDDPSGLRAGLAGNSGMSVEQVADCPIFLTGSPAEIREGLERRRERFGLSYITIQGRDPQVLELFAEHVVGPLAGK